jgi:hypothetical protein
MAIVVWKYRLCNPFQHYESPLFLNFPNFLFFRLCNCKIHFGKIFSLGLPNTEKNNKDEHLTVKQQNRFESGKSFSI